MRSLALLSLLSSVSAHAVFNGLFVNGKSDSTCIRAHNNNSPVTDVHSNDIRCNRGGATGVPGICAVQVC
jgi:lytic cellulose monooxygenase (C1-hydroxylating)